MNECHSFKWARVLVKDKNELYSVDMEHIDETPAQRKKSSAILEAARQHFAAHGFEATKLASVARDAGVAVGTIYLRYKSKSELLDGVLSDVDQAFSHAMDRPEIWQTGFPERFSVLVEAAFETGRREEHLAELMALAPLASHASHGTTKPMLQKIEEHIRDGIAREELRPDIDPALTARMAHGMVDGAMRALMSEPAQDPREAAAAIADAYARWLLIP